MSSEQLSGTRQDGENDNSPIPSPPSVGIQPTNPAPSEEKSTEVKGVPVTDEVIPQSRISQDATDDLSPATSSASDSAPDTSSTLTEEIRKLFSTLSETIKQGATQILHPTMLADSWDGPVQDEASRHGRKAFGYSTWLMFSRTVDKLLDHVDMLERRSTTSEDVPEGRKDDFRQDVVWGLILFAIDSLTTHHPPTTGHNLNEWLEAFGLAVEWLCSKTQRLHDIFVIATQTSHWTRLVDSRTTTELEMMTVQLVIDFANLCISLVPHQGSRLLGSPACAGHSRAFLEFGERQQRTGEEILRRIHDHEITLATAGLLLKLQEGSIESLLEDEGSDSQEQCWPLRPARKRSWAAGPGADDEAGSNSDSEKTVKRTNRQDEGQVTLSSLSNSVDSDSAFDVANYIN